MLGFIWQYYRWYDDLRLRGLDAAHFLIMFVPFVISVVAISLWGNGYITNSTPALLSIIFLGGSLITRIYWVHSSIGKKYPSLISKK